MNNKKPDHLLKINPEDKTIKIILDQFSYTHKAETRDQFYEVLDQIAGQDLDTRKKVLAHCHDGVPAHIRKRAGSHSISDYYKAIDIAQASLLIHSEMGALMSAANAVIVGFELGRDYERKANRIVKALNGFRLRFRPKIKANRDMHNRLLHEFKPLNYQRIKPIPTTKAIKQ